MKITCISRKYYENTGLSEDEITKIISSFQKQRSPLCIEYHTNKGKTIEEAIAEISKIQSERSKKNKSKITVRTEKYWTNLGFSEIEAKLKVSDVQNRGLDYYVKKHGEELGKEKYLDFCAKMQKVNSNNVNIRVKNNKPPGMSSKTANKILEEVSKNIETNLYYGNNHEKFLTRKNKYYFYDGYLPEYKILIELHGGYAHADPIKYGKTPNILFYGKTALRVRRKDLLKKLLAEKQVFTLLTFWIPYSRSAKSNLNFVTHITNAINQIIYEKTINL